MRMVQGKTLKDKGRLTHIRDLCNNQEISQFIRDRRNYGNKHVFRMNPNKLVRKVKYEISTEEKRECGRPPKR